MTQSKDEKIKERCEKLKVNLNRLKAQHYDNFLAYIERVLQSDFAEKKFDEVYLVKERFFEDIRFKIHDLLVLLDGFFGTTPNGKKYKVEKYFAYSTAKQEVEIRTNTRKILEDKNSDKLLKIGDVINVDNQLYTLVGFELGTDYPVFSYNIISTVLRQRVFKYVVMDPVIPFSVSELGKK